MCITRRFARPSRRRWALAAAFASAAASGLPAASGACPVVAAGGVHSLVLDSDGTVWSWGDNSTGQLGNGSFWDLYLPGQVKDQSGTKFLTGITAIAAGGLHSLAVKGDGSVWAWGYGFQGELGNGRTTSASLPVQVKDTPGTGFLTDVIAVAAGSEHSLALKSDGSVWKWGDLATLPAQVKGPGGTGFLTGITAIASGSYHSLALKNDGSVWAWGANFSGQLGNGSTADSAFPVQVKGPLATGFLTGITAIVASESLGAYRGHSLALKSDGSLCAWGWNAYGELGNGTTTDSSLPVRVLDATGAGFLGGVTDIAAGSNHSLAVKGDGSLWAWGQNTHGQFGNGTTTPSSLPVQALDPSGIGLLTGVTAADGGGDHSLAAKGDGSLWAWGWNFNGELGNGTANDSHLPVQASLNLTPGVPPDQGNALLAAKRGGDVLLMWTGTGTSSWGVYRDPAKSQLGFTAIPPTVSAASFVDAGRTAFPGDDFYRVKGLSPCGAGL